jgi:RsiW-degrading membrane proteinase PrsW (M82 family)
MQIHLLQDKTQTGPFPLEEVRKMVAAGERSLHDYAWHQGLAHWVPLFRIFSAHTSSVPPPPPSSRAGLRIHLRQRAEAVFQGITGEITTVAGVERIEGLKGSEFLSNVLKRRKDDEMEELFITGTRSATPLLKDIDTHWPKPWVFFRSILISLVIFGGFYIGSVPMHNQNMIPGAILVGSFAIPCSTLIFFIEMNVARNFSVYQILKLVFMGGLVALLIAVFLADVLPPQTDSEGSPTWAGAALTGLVEESAKLFAAVFFMGRRRFNWSLNGLLIGAAVGTGFAAFESAGYALSSLLVFYQQMITDQNAGEWNQVVGATIHAIELRALFAPCTHIVWGALAVAALWKVKGDNPFKWRMLLDQHFLRVFAIAILLHTLWDCPWSFPFMGEMMGTLLRQMIIGIVAWVAVFGFIQDGLKQIRLAQSILPPLPPELSSAGPS